MTKKYLNEIENLEQIITFDANELELLEDENGQYFKDAEDFDWWQELANSMQYLEDKEVEYDRTELNELEDYIILAKANGYGK